MDAEEARQWFLGNRSTHNSFDWIDKSKDIAACAQADAGMLEKAYWVLKAHKEGLIRESDNKEIRNEH